MAWMRLSLKMKMRQCNVSMGLSHTRSIDPHSSILAMALQLNNQTANSSTQD